MDFSLSGDKLLQSRANQSYFVILSSGGFTFTLEHAQKSSHLLTACDLMNSKKTGRPAGVGLICWLSAL